MYDVNHWPERCPFGHVLGPGKGSLSYDSDRQAHWLLCRVDGCRSRILLAEGGRWETLVGDRWVAAGDGSDGAPHHR